MSVREIVKVRMVAGSLVVSLPQSVLEPVGLKEGDRVVVEASPPRRLLITKEGKIMTSTQRLEMEIDLLEKKKIAMESDLTYKARQHNDGMPCDQGMEDNDVAILMLMQLVRDRDRLDVEIAEKRMQLYEVQAGDVVVLRPGRAEEEVVPSLPLKTASVWYHWIDKDGHGYFLAFVNRKGSCSVRRFDVDSGMAVRSEKNRKGDFRDSFSAYLEKATLLHLSKPPRVEDCKLRLPSSTLVELRQQIKPKS
jgi:antitoxin component of MazEF toxin-antitoxin module